MDDNFFKGLCKAENAVLASIETKEIPSDEMAFKSIIIVNSMRVDGAGDAMLYAAALNVLNTYVKLSKENKNTVGYFFKNKVKVLFNYILKNPDNENLDAEIQEDKGTNMGIVEIYGIQFSFHTITVTDKMLCLKAKDPEHPRLPWDGIRKQQCSVSLFEFAYGNTFERTNKKTDGEDFAAYIDGLTDEFKAGTKTIKDVLNSDRRGEMNKSEDDSSANMVINEYPDKNRFIVSIENYDLGSLTEKIRGRTLVPELNSKYQKKTGQYLSYMNTLSAKYAFQTLLDLIIAADLDPTVGVKISYSKVLCYEGFIVILASELPDGRANIVSIELLNWTTVKEAENGYISVFDEYTGFYRTTARPGMHKIGEIFTKFRDNPVVSVNSDKHCILLYDAEKKNNCSVLTAKSGEFDVPVFCPSEMDMLCAYIKPELENGNGGKITRAMDIFFNSITASADGSLSSEHKIAVENCIEYIKSDNSGLMVISYRKAKNNTSLHDYLADQLKKAGIAFDEASGKDGVKSSKLSDTVLFDGSIPDEKVFDSYKNVIVLCDMYAPKNAAGGILDEIDEYAYDNGISIYRTDMLSVLGFSDGGRGNGFILKNLGLSPVEIQKYSAENYPVYLAKSEEGLVKDGIRRVIIPEHIGYDFESRNITASVEEQEAIYQELLDAPESVRLVIENPVLYSYVEGLLARHVGYEEKILEARTSSDEELKEVLETIKKNSGNSADYNKCQAVAVQQIHKDAWNKLSDSSQDWIVSGISSYFYMKDTDTEMDFSGVALLISKAFEVELGKRISEEYFDYIKEKYGDNYLTELPEPLVKESYGNLEPQNPSQTTLGSMTYVMGLNAKGYIVNQKSYDNFLSYCRDVLLVHPENAEQELAELCDVITYVRVNFRNTSAHKGNISFETATDCISYCITEKRKLGVVMDMFRK